MIFSFDFSATTVIYNGMCATTPVVVWLIINQDWEFQVPLIDLTYEPWRLFVVFCGVPGFFSAVVMQFLPESPKFVLNQGNKTEAYQIVQKMNRWNNGKGSELEEFEILAEIESNENKNYIFNSNEKTRFAFFNSVWNQTAQLFKPPYLKSTILLCTMQFSIYSVFHGLFMFFAEIINGMSNNLDSFVDDRMKMCEAINLNKINTSAVEFDEMNSEVSFVLVKRTYVYY